MSVIDADVHVLETEQTFSFLSSAEQKYKPTIVRVDEGGGDSSRIPLTAGAGAHLWIIDGKPYGKHNIPAIEEKAKGEIPSGTLDLRNPKVRLETMDKQGVDVAVIYPSLFLVTNVDEPAAEIALARSYNRWMHSCCQADPRRLRWVAVIAPRLVQDTIAEMKWAKAHGAVGVMLRGLERDGTPLQSEFDPIFAAAVDLDLPILLHIGVGNGGFRALRINTEKGSDPFVVIVPVLIAFSVLMRSDHHKRFPGLRFGIIEAGSAWLPFLGTRAIRARGKTNAFDLVREAMSERNIYISCEEHEDIPDILKYAGENNLVLGSDYGHPGDVADSIFVQRTFKSRPDISDASKTRILETNSKRLFGL